MLNEWMKKPYISFSITGSHSVYKLRSHLQVIHAKSSFGSFSQCAHFHSVHFLSCFFFVYILLLQLKGQRNRILDFDFFHETSSPWPLMIPLAPFSKFSKICEAVCYSRCTQSHSCTRCYIIFQDFHWWLASSTFNIGRQQWPTLVACD
jgi:hypothetical protein